jgi:hypothetical protein
MPDVVRIPITNIYAGGPYTGRIFVGAKNKPMNVFLDTGSSTLVLSRHAYRPDTGKGDLLTRFAQTVDYADNSSWTGAVIHTSVSIGEVRRVAIPDANVAIAYYERKGVFDGYDGILGLAYTALDDAALMPKETWPKRYTQRGLQRNLHKRIKPYLNQLAKKGITFDKISFYTRRSTIHYGAGVANDPLNHGWMIVGGGEEAKDLYFGRFQTARVMSQKWYNTNLKAIIVGDTDPIHVPKGSRSGNSIVDSGTQDLELSRDLWNAIRDRFDASKRALLKPDGIIAMSELDLAEWPLLTVILEGEAGDVILRIEPGDYWQINNPRAGSASLAISPSHDGSITLGLPLMNGHFTIFDGEADHGKGAIRFAARR